MLKSNRERSERRFFVWKIQHFWQNHWSAAVRGGARRVRPPWIRQWSKCVKCIKLCWKGAAVIAKKISASLDPVKTKIASLMVNYDRLKPCHGRILPKWFTDWLKDPVLPEDPEDQDTVYCLCRKPHQWRFMMQYDWCDEWLFVHINLFKSQKYIWKEGVNNYISFVIINRSSIVWR